MKKLMFVSAVAIGALLSTAPAQAQTQRCPPGQSGTFPYCQVVPPPPPPAGCDKFTSKLSLLRGTFNRRDRTISILAPITRLASGNARIELFAAGRRTSFNGPINSALGRIRVIRSITASQARLGTGILTINYPGDADTRPQEVRLRAANNPAGLRLARPQYNATTGRLTAQGNVVRRARGVVRIQLEYVNRADGQTVTLKFRARINSQGRWRLNTQLPPGIIAQIARRCGTLHSYTLFTGYLPRRIRGEMRSFQVLGSQ